MTNIRNSLIILLLGMPFTVWASGHVDSAALSQAKFHFKHQSFAVGSQHSNNHDQGDATSDNLTNQSVFLDKGNVLSGHFEQFDATITYPFTPRESVNFDLGINIRFIDADLIQSETELATHNLNAAIPMFYANAIFGLPYDGLSASLGASHVEYEQYYAFDYKAKLSYQWQNGFGMEGGWQHQALSIDGSDFQTEIENQGLFLDFNYRF